MITNYSEKNSCSQSRELIAQGLTRDGAIQFACLRGYGCHLVIDLDAFKALLSFLDYYHSNELNQLLNFYRHLSPFAFYLPVSLQVSL